MPVTESMCNTLSLMKVRLAFGFSFFSCSNILSGFIPITDQQPCSDVLPCGLASGPSITVRARHSPVGAMVSVMRSEEHTSELQSLMRISYAVFCLKKKKYKAHDETTSR